LTGDLFGVVLILQGALVVRLIFHFCRCSGLRPAAVLDLLDDGQEAAVDLVPAVSGCRLHGLIDVSSRRRRQIPQGEIAQGCMKS
jgi:hypothetical protein